MPGLRAVGFAFATMTLSADVAFAQNNNNPGATGGGAAVGLGRAVATPGGGAGFVTVLMTPAVQDELKLSADQKTKVFELARGAQQKGRALLQATLQSGGTPQAMMAAGLRVRRENEAAASAILTSEQKDRVEQIMLQIEGPLAVVRPEVAARLNMTARQNQLAQQALIQMGQSVRGLLMEQAASGGNVALGAAGLPREAMARVRGAATQQLGRVLDAKQKSRFNTMLGEPFDLSKIDPELAPVSEPSAPTPAAKAKARRKGASTPSARSSAAKDDEATKP